MPAVTRKMADLKNEILAKLDEKFCEFKSDFINEIKDQIKNEVSEACQKCQHVKNFQKHDGAAEWKRRFRTVW